MRNAMMLGLWMRLPVFQAPGEPGAGADAGAPPAAAPPAGAAKWFETDAFDPEARDWLAAKGLAVDDPAEVLPKLVKGHREAEKRIGKGLDNIIDKPAKDQPFAEWARANAEVLGLPAAADDYAVEPPKDWPKEIPWDASLEQAARAVAFEAGVPKAAHEAYVGLFAQHVLNLEKASAEGFAKAEAEMMTELQRDYGDKTPAVIARAQQGMAMLAEKAGLGAEGIQAVSQLVSDKAGSAAVIRLMNAVGELMGEDALLGAGQGAAAMTRETAQAEMHKLSSPGGEWYEATMKGDRTAIQRLKPQIDRLARIAAGGK